MAINLYTNLSSILYNNMEEYKSKILKSFDSKAHTYEEYSIAQKEISKRMIERLLIMKFKPHHILDLGCGTGFLSELLSKQFPNAKLTCLDISENMLTECRKKNNGFNLVSGDIENLPFSRPSFDLIVSSFTLHWCEQIDKVFKDALGLLFNKGLFMFTTVGPKTLQELQEAYSKIDSLQHINTFSDMHLYGDSLLNCGFKDPVMDMEEIIFQYSTFRDVLNSLKKTGANTVIGQNKSHMSKENYKNLLKAYPQSSSDNSFSVTYEMIYGIGWKNITEKEIVNSKVIPIKKI